MALTVLAPRYPNYTGNTQDDKYDIPGRTDIANAWDYNTHDAEILAHQSLLYAHAGQITILQGWVNQSVTTTSSPTFVGLTLDHFNTFPTTPLAMPSSDFQVANKLYVDSFVGVTSPWTYSAPYIKPIVDTASVVPAASGTQSIGTAGIPWDTGYFNTLYGDGSHLTGISTVTSFIQLTDAPHSYAGQAGMAVRVNATQTSLEFYSAAGFSGYSGYSGAGFSGYSGYSGTGGSGYSGYSGASGYMGSDGASGYSGYSGERGLSGYSGKDGTAAGSGYSGYSGEGISGFSGYSGDGGSGYSGYSGEAGLSGYSGSSGYVGMDGASGYSGWSGYSGLDGVAQSGVSGYSGYSGDSTSGFSGYSGVGGTGESGYSGYSGDSGLSGYSGVGVSGFSGISGYSGAGVGALFLDDLVDVTVPAPVRDEVLKWNGTAWVNATYNTTFAMTIAAFDAGQASPQLMGLSSSVWKAAGAISFTASYNNPPPNSAWITMSGSSVLWANALNLVNPYTSGVTQYDTKYPSSRDGTITFTLTAMDGATPRTSAVGVLFNNYIYYGASTTGSGFTEANVEALTPSLSSAYTTSRAINAGAGQYLVLAYPSSYTSIHATGFRFNSVTCPFNAAETVSITNSASFVENYKVFASVNTNLGNSTLVVSTSDSRIDNFYYGGSTLNTGWSEAQIKALTDLKSPITNTTTGTWSLVNLAASEYFIFAYPSRCTDPTNWYDNATGFQLALKAGSPQTISITNVNGYTQNYDVWVSENILGPGPFTLRTS